MTLDGKKSRFELMTRPDEAAISRQPARQQQQPLMVASHGLKNQSFHPKHEVNI